jgi:ABC-2 type transport system permease protein
MTLKRATPMPPFAYFVAKLAMAALFGAIIVFLLAIVGVTFGGVSLTPDTWLRLIVVLIAGTIPFSALGLALGYLTGPNSAPAIVNLVYLPLSFASGLWIPIEMLPTFMKSLAPALPPYHLAQLALASVGAARGGPAWSHVAALAGFTLVGLALASIAYRRDEDANWG